MIYFEKIYFEHSHEAPTPRRWTERGIWTLTKCMWVCKRRYFFDQLQSLIMCPI